MSNIIFPEGISWECRYATGADFLPSNAKINGQGLYRYAKNNIIDVKADVSGTTSTSYMFGNCAAKYIKNLNISNATNCEYMFSQAGLIVAPSFDTSQVTNTSYMFQTCNKLMYIPPLDLSGVQYVNYTFSSCTNLVNVPATNLGSVTSSLAQLFANCENLVDIPNMDISSATNFGSSSYQSWLYSASAVKSIGILECDSITNIAYVFGGGVNYRIKHLGGFRNLGKKSSVSGTNGSYFLDYAPNLTYESVMNVINLLYDRATAGLSVLTLKLHPNHLAMLSEDDIAIATNKGWTLV